MIEYLYYNVKPALFRENVIFLTCTCRRNLSVYSGQGFPYFGLNNIFYLNLVFAYILSPNIHFIMFEQSNFDFIN